MQTLNSNFRGEVSIQYPKVFNSLAPNAEIKFNKFDKDKFEIDEIY